MNISLEQARTIVSSALAHGKSAGMKPLCVAVLDAGGYLVAFEREDGVANRRFDVANGKAYGAISVGMSSRRIGEAAVERPHFVNGLISAMDGRLVPVPGGVLVTGDDGSVIGAVGCSGDTSDNDEIAVLAGIEAAGLSAQI